jgi:hypothetical protein
LNTFLLKDHGGEIAAEIKLICSTMSQAAGWPKRCTMAMG